MKLFLTILFLCNSIAFADEFNYKLLSDRRSELKLPAYSLETKKLIIGQARLIMDQLYAHRELKLNDFGVDSDPLPLLDQLEAKADTISEEEFHQTMLNIIGLQHDLHADYYLPRPYACHRNILPIAFGEVKNKFRNKLVVTSLVTDNDILKLLPEPLNVKLGDELVSYNGKSIEELFQSTRQFNPGANIEAQRRIFISRLSLQIQGTIMAPKENNVQLVFRTFWGKKYKRSIPWINRRRNSCADKYDNSQISGKNSRVQFAKEYSELFFKFKKKPNEDSNYHETKEPGITWRILNYRQAKLGVLKISSFLPEKVTYEVAVIIIKKLLQNELAETDALVLDLRNNGGGLIPYGELLVQFFTPNKITPLNFKMRAVKNNLLLLDKRSSIYQSEVLQLQESISNNQFLTLGLPLTPEYKLNQYGQVYFKPTAILTNSNCYSTCDMITAQFQDHKVGLVFGEDETTGAGGANNIWQSDYDYISSVGFKKLPFDQDLGISWRQTYRVGINDGMLIENVGVKSDVVLPVTFRDLTEDGKDQMKRIMRLLLKN